MAFDFEESVGGGGRMMRRVIGAIGALRLARVVNAPFQSCLLFLVPTLVQSKGESDQLQEGLGVFVN